MVRRDVWLAAVPWNTDGGMFDFLCIGFLEARVAASSPSRISLTPYR